MLSSQRSKRPNPLYSVSMMANQAPSAGGLGHDQRQRFLSQTSVLSEPDMIDPNELFINFPILEVQRNHKKIQRDIERKHSEMRTMVGERYRELINTADTIANMEKTVSDIQSTLRSVNDTCAFEEKKSEKEQQEHSKKEEFWQIASQMKLLVDTPDKIWNAMEHKNFLIAAQLYLLSRHIVTNLHIGSGQGAQLLTAFPVLPQQWGAISHFKSSISQGCRTELQQAVLSGNQFTDCLCAIVILEGRDVADVLEELLTHRAQAVVSALKSSASVREQLTNCLDALTTTLTLLYTEVNPEDGFSKLLNKLEHVTTRVTTTEIVGSAFQQEAGLQAITRHLPALVLSYHPTLLTSTQLPDLTVISQNWLDDVIDRIRSTLPTSLQYIGSVTSLATLAKPFWQPASIEWDTVCRAMVNHPINLWTMILSQPFNQHVKQVISMYVPEAIQLTERDITKCLQDPSQADVLDFVWGDDVKEDQLQMRGEALSPEIQSLAIELDVRLKAIYNDIIAYTGFPERSRSKEVYVVPDELYSHINTTIHNSIQALCQQSINPIIESVDLESIDSPDVYKLVTLIHICRALIKYCPQLRTLLLLHETHEKQRSAQFKSRSNIYSVIEETKGTLLSKYGSWLICTLTKDLMLDSCPLPYATGWEDIKIDEETESGSSVESSISLPVHVSSNINTLLLILSTELYRMGCQGLSQADFSLILCDMRCAIVRLYERWLGLSEDTGSTYECDIVTPTVQLSQNRAIQAWLDVRYISAMLGGSGVSADEVSARNKKVSKITSHLEGCIDPFDWDVFQSHLTNNLHNLIRRTHCLYGAVSAQSTAVQAVVAATRNPSHQTLHNIVPLPGSTPQRLQLLPVRVEDDKDKTVDEGDDQTDWSQMRKNLLFFSSPLVPC